MKFQDYYQTLGVSRTASPDEIKRAYRKLALEHHPDRHPPERRAAAEAKFKAITEANEVLSDPEKRKRYDALGEHWREGQDFRPPPGGGFRQMDPEEFARMFGGAGGGGGGGFSDFFASMFGDLFREQARGAGRPGQGQRAPFGGRGQDVEAELPLPVGDALQGGKRTFQLPAAVECEQCDGSGRLGNHLCPACAGQGRLRREKTVTLTISDDIRDGQVLRLRGLGEPGGPGAAPGDLLLRVALRDDDGHRVRGDHVEADAAVAPWEAVAGGRIDVAVRGRTLSVNVPAGSRAGQKLRLRGQGLSDGHGGRGDLVLVLRLVLPEELTEVQRGALRRAGEGAGPVRGGVRV